MMADPTRAEIEQVAIALYESDCRDYNQGSPSYSSGGLDGAGDPVQSAVVRWANKPAWHRLDRPQRAYWRRAAVEMLEETADNYPAGPA